jgi:hypothetical protein
MNMFSPSATYRTKRLRNTANSLAVTDRQERLTGFNQQALTQAKVILIGAGGLGGECGEALVRKGVGELVILDHDVVEPTNLNRQRFYARDLYKNKARRLPEILPWKASAGRLFRGIALVFRTHLSRALIFWEALPLLAWTTIQGGLPHLGSTGSKVCQ